MNARLNNAGASVTTPCSHAALPGQQYDFAVRVTREAQVDGVAPLLERIRLRDRETERSFGGERCVLRQQDGQRGQAGPQFVEVDARAEVPGLLMVADRHHAA